MKKRHSLGVRLTVLFALLALTAAACASDGESATSDTGDPAGGDVTAETSADATTTTTAEPLDMGTLTRIGADDPLNQDPVVEGAERIRYTFGPIKVKPGQNNIEFSNSEIPKPEVDGFIVRIAPNLMREDGSVPPVDVVHLHHGVWLNQSRSDATAPLPERIFAAGEEKTVATTPAGFGYEYKADDQWVINYMIHNIFPTNEDIWMTYDLDFIPADAPEAADIVPVRPIWLDVDNGSVYPVFDVIQGSGGDDGEYVYPDDDPDVAGSGINEWEVDTDGLLVGTGGHLHPGGLSVDFFLQRDGAGAVPGSDAADDVEGDKAHIFNSRAEYFEPAGPVSWDLSMTVTPPDWLVKVKQGDILSINTTYETEFGSWYEAMGIGVVWMASGSDFEGLDPFVDKVNLPGKITHPHLAENDNHGGDDIGLPDPESLPDGEFVSTIGIADFVYEYGDFSEGEVTVPLVRQGESITFDNSVDAPLENGIWHTVTACELPCNGSTGIAFPLAGGEIFDSGQLGDAGEPTAGTVTWETPDDLAPGTYTYFCRVHPFMRGAFRVVPPDYVPAGDAAE